jgi:CDP-diacylglycerol--inositol 3-phosphatidyltransferase
MVTDRFSTAALVSILGLLYPKYLFYLILLNILDFTSHWYRMYCSLYTGAESHKNSTEMPAILQFYYTNKVFMAILCVGNELFYIYLYEYFHFSSLLKPYHFLFQFLIIPTWAMKQLMNIIQLYSSSIELIEFELKKKK